MKYPFIISIPHCSERIPKEIKSNLALSSEEIQESTDRGVLEIFGSLPAKKIVSAKWNRLVVDLNRSHSKRGAKGVVSQLDYHGRSIYRSGYTPNEQEIERRLSDYYWPFHKHLVDALKETNIKALFDCHSLNGTGPKEAPDPGKRRNDIVLGNHGDDSGNMIPAGGSITCPPETLQFIKKVFTKAGFSVSLNDPYPGGFITAYHGKKLKELGKIAVQIEINQDLYLEGTPKRLSPIRLENIKARVSQTFKEIASKL